MSNERSISGRQLDQPTTPSTILATMDQCTKCGVCQSHCPVLAATPAFPGPKYAGPQAERFRVIEHAIEHSSDLCTGCGICTSVCPNNVAISDIIALAKAGKAQNGSPVSLGQKLLNRPDMIGMLGGLAPRIANAVLGNGGMRRLAETVLGIHRHAPLPKFSGPAFRKWLASHQQPQGPEILYFSGCAVENFDPKVGIAAVCLLNRLGFNVVVPTQACCSLPMLSSGEWAPARKRAESLVKDLASRLGPAPVIITSSTSCGLTLKSKYAAYLDLNSRNAKSVSSSTSDICEFLRERGIEALAKHLKPLKSHVFYHAPCQLRGHGIGFPALELLRTIDGLSIDVSNAGCCGIGGTYGYDEKKHDISMEIAKPLNEQVRDSKPDLIACDSETCRWHLEAMTGVQTVHPIEILAMSMDM